MWVNGICPENYPCLKKLRYNSYAIKCTILRCTIKCFLVFSQGCATVTTVEFQDIFISPKSASEQTLPVPIPPPPATSSLLPISVALPLAGISSEFNWTSFRGRLLSPSLRFSWRSSMLLGSGVCFCFRFNAGDMPSWGPNQGRCVNFAHWSTWHPFNKDQLRIKEQRG